MRLKNVSVDRLKIKPTLNFVKLGRLSIKFCPINTLQSLEEEP